MAQLKPDLAQARRFLSLLDPAADMRDLLEGIPDGFTFQTFDDLKSRGDKTLASIRSGSFESLKSELLRLNKKRAGVFVTINETDMTGRRTENLTRIRAIWIEDDTGASIPLPLEPHIVTETSPGKFHKIILVDGLTPEQHLRLEEILISHYGSDPQAKDLVRVLRVPGFFHCKGDPFLVKLVHEAGTSPYGAEEVMRAFDYENAVISLPPRTRTASLASDNLVYSDEYQPLSLDDKQPLPDITLESAAIYLPPPGAQSRAEWLTVGMALHHQFDGADEALSLWDTWSQQVREYQGFEDLAYNWHTFGRRSAGPLVTFRYLVKDFNERLGKKNTEESVDVLISAEGLIHTCDDYMSLVNHIAPALWKLADHNLVYEKDFSSALIKRYSELRPGHALTAKDALRAMKQKAPIVTPDDGPTLTMNGNKTPHWAQNWVWVSEEEIFLNTKSRVRLTASGFNAHFNSKLPKSDEMGRNAAAFLLDSDLIPKAMRARYIPHQPALFFYEGEVCVNSYSDAHRAKVPESIGNKRAVEVFKRHIELVFGGWTREAQIFVNWLSATIAEKPVKVRWSPLIVGTYGDGKSLFHTFVQCAIGASNTRTINSNTILASVNTGQTGWCEGQVFASVEELKWHGHNRYDAINVIKPYISNTFVSCRRMRMDPYDILNTTNYLFFSNFKDCIPVDEGERRYFVIFSKMDLKSIEENYFDVLHDAIQNHTGDLIAWLRSIAVHKDFKADGTAPMTAAKESMIKQSSDDFDDTVKDILHEDEDSLYGKNVICFNPLFKRLVIDSDGALKPTDGYRLTRVLVALGFAKVGRAWLDGERHTIWTKDKEGVEVTLEDAKALLEERLLKSSEKGLGYDKVVSIDSRKRSG